MGRNNSKIRVIITGADHPTGLGTARAIATTAHCQIIGLCRQHSPCCRSKHWDELIKVNNDHDIIDLLILLGKKQDRKTALFMSQDSVVKTVSEQRELLQEHYLFHLPPREVVDVFLDKVLFHQWALKHGFCVPASNSCKSREELEDSLKEIRFPVIVKPNEKTESWHKASPLHKAFRLNNRQEFNHLPIDLFRAAPEVIVQQWIPGGDSCVYFCLVYYDKSSTMLASYTGRKLFQWPRTCGSTAAAIGVENPKLSYLTERLFNSAGCQGLASLEFKRSDLDGQFYIIEPTIGRNDLQSNLALAGGTNLTALALADILNEQTPNIKKRKAAWICEEQLLDAVRASRKDGSLRMKNLFRLLKANVAFAHFSMADPLPALTLLDQKIRPKVFGK